MWLSIIPPWVGSGCRQISVAMGSRPCGRASSPTRLNPSAVRSAIGDRSAGSTVEALISLTDVSSLPRVPAAVSQRRRSQARLRSISAALARAAVQPPLPAGPVPVPPQVGPRALGRPRHDVRRAGRYFLITAGTAVFLRGCGAPGPPDDPLPAPPPLAPFGP